MIGILKLLFGSLSSSRNEFLSAVQPNYNKTTKPIRRFKVSVNENFSTLLDFVFFFFLDFRHEWVLHFILAEKENQKVLFNSSKMSLFCFPPKVAREK